MTTCWCGVQDLRPFSPEYLDCPACGTLVFAQNLSAADLEVRDDEADFYGKNYWIKHQTENFGYSDFETRSRADLTERNLFWLKALLRLRHPPGKILELGCAHGSFVALLNQCGFDAMGLEMSPWIVEFGRQAFAVDILQGPVEHQELPKGSLDAIVLMDVIEHLPDPSGTMAHCLELLKPDGILLIQTPDYRPGMVFEKLVEEKAAFLEQLKPREHLFLFSPASIETFFKRLGAEYVRFFPAIFDQYDMFLAVSRMPLADFGDGEMVTCLSHSAPSRIVLALLDLYDQLKANREQLAGVEVDRAARYDQIQTLAARLEESEADRLARHEQIITLTEMVHESNADRERLSQALDALREDLAQLLNRRFVRRISKTAGFDEVERLIERIEGRRG